MSDTKLPADNVDSPPQNTLLHCPFCGCEKTPIELGNQCEENFQLKCADCHTTTGRYRTRHEAIKAWYQRALAPADNAQAVQPEDLEGKETDVNAGGAPKQKWSPIESAPKDGTTIDLWANECRWTDCYWGKPSHSCGEAGEYCDSDWHTDKPGWVYAPYCEPLSATPTHWMLPPKAPSVGQSTDEQSQPLLSQESPAVSPSVAAGVEEKRWRVVESGDCLNRTNIKEGDHFIAMDLWPNAAHQIIAAHNASLGEPRGEK